MKKKIVLFFTIFFLCSFSQAQISRGSFDEAIDLLNCKTVVLSMHGHRNLDDFKYRFPCGRVSYEEIHQFLISVGDLDKTVRLSNEIESLKRSFNENWGKGEAIDFLSEKIFADKIRYQKVFDFAEKRKGKPEFDAYKANLKIDLSNTLAEDGQPTIVEPSVSTEIQEPALRDDTFDQERDVTKNSGESSGSKILTQTVLVSAFVSLLFSFLTLFLALKLFRMREKKLQNSSVTYTERPMSEVFSGSITSARNIHASELKEVTERIGHLELMVKDLRDQTDLAASIPGLKTQQSNPETIRPEEEKTEVFFLSTPNSDGSFNESSASSTYREGATIYKFIKIGPGTAKFQIDERDASSRLALQFPDKSIDPVCEAVNAFNPRASRVVSVEQGEAELQSGKWIVDRSKKAKIKYED